MMWSYFNLKYMILWFHLTPVIRDHIRTQITTNSHMYEGKGSFYTPFIGVQMNTIALKIILEISFKKKEMSNSWSNCRTLRQPLNGLHSGQTLLFIPVHCCSTHSRQEEESIWTFMGMTVYGESVTHIQTGILLSHKEKVNQVNFWQMTL